MTNLEKIRAMSADELVEFLMCLYDACSYCPARRECRKFGRKHSCNYTIKYWLESEVKE